MKKWGKNGLVHLHFCCFFFAFSICFFLLLFCFFLFCFLPGKKQNKSNKKAKKTNRKNKKKMQMDKSIFSPLFFFLSFHFFRFFFPLLFCFWGCWILLICFLVFPFFLHFSRFFSSLKKIRINGGLVNLNITIYISLHFSRALGSGHARTLSPCGPRSDHLRLRETIPASSCGNSEHRGGHQGNTAIR